MAFDYKSLLGKNMTPGQNWGQLAAAYFSSNNKDTKKRRNALIAMLGFNAVESKRQNDVLKNLQELEDNKTVAIAKAQAEYNNRAKILEAQEGIKKLGAYKYFDADADAWFNNPANQQEGFDPLDYEDVNSPLYNSKRKAKQRYIDEVLMPRHDSKYYKIDKNIQTFEEYSKPVKDYFKAQSALASSPGKTSLVHKGLNFIGIGSDKKYIDEVNRTKAIVDKYNERRTTKDIGKIFATDYDDNFKLKNAYTIATATPKGKTFPKGTAVGMLPSEIEAGQLYTEGQFRRSEMFKELKTSSAKNEALKIFKGLAENERTEEEVLSIVNTATVIDAINTREQLFNSYKNSDEEFNKRKPKADSYETDTLYKKALAGWNNERDAAYSRGGAKYAATRKAAGYNVTLLEEYESQIDQFIDYQIDVTQQAELIGLEDDPDTKEDESLQAISQEQFEEFRAQRKNELLAKFASAKMLENDKMASILEGSFEKSISGLDTWLVSSDGDKVVQTFKDNYEEKNPGKQMSITRATELVRQQRMRQLTQGYINNLSSFGINVPGVEFKVDDDLDEILED
tara:strand:+ start:1783 stop:3486 length:1704 start_codon:yes stop_codon:yes gene_type:complete